MMAELNQSMKDLGTTSSSLVTAKEAVSNRIHPSLERCVCCADSSAAFQPRHKVFPEGFNLE